jgi:RNA-dependent RNA polymerase
LFHKKHFFYGNFVHAVAIINGEMDNDSTTARMISSGMPLSEPYLQDRLSWMVNTERTKLKEGKLPISESFYLMGTADPTGVLKNNEVCVVLYVDLFCALIPCRL